MLDIGCGEGPKKGDIGVDFRKTSSVDIVADARMLPFKDESFDHVYSSHLIEHFSHREVRNVLFEWVRVLKGGAPSRFVVLISVPELSYSF
jgi:predicted SAM-dependent methyltransferase